MRRLAFALAVLLAPAAAGAGELPALADPCTDPGDAADCRALEDEARAWLEAQRLPPPLLDLCAARARYDGDGYGGMQICVEVELRRERGRKLASAYDPAERCRRERAPNVRARCLDREREAKALVMDSDVLPLWDKPELFDACFEEGRRAGGSFVAYVDCMQAKHAASLRRRR